MVRYLGNFQFANFTSFPSSFHHYGQLDWSEGQVTRSPCTHSFLTRRTQARRIGTPECIARERASPARLYLADVRGDLRPR